MNERKKVYVVCCKDEYKLVAEHLGEIIDPTKEDVILPFSFFQYEQIDTIINLVTLKIIEKMENKHQEFAKILAKEEWYNRKYQHFLSKIEDVNQIIILDNNSFTCDEQDIEEKNREMDYSLKSDKHIKRIDAGLFKKKEGKMLKKSIN